MSRTNAGEGAPTVSIPDGMVAWPGSPMFPNTEPGKKPGKNTYDYHRETLEPGNIKVQKSTGGVPHACKDNFSPLTYGPQDVKDRWGNGTYIVTLYSTAETGRDGHMEKIFTRTLRIDDADDELPFPGETPKPNARVEEEGDDEEEDDEEEDDEELPDGVAAAPPPARGHGAAPFRDAVGADPRGGYGPRGADPRDPHARTDPGYPPPGYGPEGADPRGGYGPRGADPRGAYPPAGGYPPPAYGAPGYPPAGGYPPPAYGAPGYPPPAPAPAPAPAGGGTLETITALAGTVGPLLLGYIERQAEADRRREEEARRREEERRREDDKRAEERRLAEERREERRATELREERLREEARLAERRREDELREQRAFQMTQALNKRGEEQANRIVAAGAEMLQGARPQALDPALTSMFQNLARNVELAVAANRNTNGASNPQDWASVLRQADEIRAVVGGGHAAPAAQAPPAGGGGGGFGDLMQMALKALGPEAAQALMRGGMQMVASLFSGGGGGGGGGGAPAADPGQLPQGSWGPVTDAGAPDITPLSQ